MQSTDRALPKAPNYPIAPVLEAFGAEAVPRVRGAGHRSMRCPFHDDTSPSASVSEYGFVCYACGVTGDAIKLLREEEGISYQDAVRRCEEITGGTGSGAPRDAPSGTNWWSGSLLN